MAETLIGDSDMATNNIATQLLAKILELEPPPRRADGSTLGPSSGMGSSGPTDTRADAAARLASRPLVALRHGVGPAVEDLVHLVEVGDLGHDVDGHLVLLSGGIE